ncbi:MAG TPA: aldolase/citrate lyase family protein [Aliidongia sp.]|nr:aldolase/citrate lyase family protein [Aliidongia sp.]
MYRANAVKARLKAGQGAFGIFNNLASPLVAELSGLAGYDFVLIDGEHGAGGFEDHRAMIQAVQTTSAGAFIRVAKNDPAMLKRVLDLGVEGVMIPSISNAEEARAAIAACLYPPNGKRGYAAPVVRASEFGLRAGDYVGRGAAGAELVVMLQIETAAGAANAMEICAVGGFDVVFLGPGDLSGDLGALGRFDHPDFLKAVSVVEAAAKAHGKILGCLPYPGASLEQLWERGYRVLTPGSDVAMLREAMLQQLALLRPDRP